MKLKTTIITMLLVAASICAVAQEKYEYAQLYQQSRLVYWDADTVEITDFGENVNWFKATMRKLNMLSEKGWEVYSVTETLLNQKSGVTQVMYHLRRKKQ